ncbi:hypothetical protein [Amycolatopsis regifaucium]|uniref:Carboxypeptidase regulatory-like domain-containing protein n=1 Tax=Amycolatopsis regifaucium TaxID=546365 RepID=A0A154MNR9_9PSEU|nr:hypothetical protein [Amycolatopsis regifaucium]KZB85896.1 hypothetical protein AVL48_27150 [Amycolatopsis regifaucium]OKA03151.1 hypothetical protein ATP06_0237750 [Amycolatopsis regifaucium]SFH70915.1 hypothetical protein SAMN04489731_1061 [Amycolatopsis regifaucium]
MTTTRRVLAILASTGLAVSVLCAGSASAATQGKIYISNNCGKAVSTTIHRTDGSMIAGTSAAPAGSYFGYPVQPGTYQVRVPAGNRNVKILDLGSKAHSVIVKAC